MNAPFRIEPLGSSHDRAGFRCGIEPLDRYLRERATQDIRRRVTSCFVAIDVADPIGARIAGCYAIAAAGVALNDLPLTLARRLPRYPTVPVARLGRLAVDQAYRGRKLGSALLHDACLRASRSEVAVFAIVVDAKDEDAARFYRHHGFVDLDRATGQLVLSLATFLKARPGRRSHLSKLTLSASC